MKKILDEIAAAVLPFLASLVIKFLALTMRITYHSYDGYRRITREGGRVIIACWHGRLLMMPYCYLGKSISILVSQSRDGELIARTLKRFGMDTVRGSTTRGWLSGVKGLLKSAREGKDLAITPDGPKGPGMKVQMGVIHIAKATGLPIMPVSFSALKKKLSAAGTAS